MLGASVENFEATWEAQRRGEIPAALRDRGRDPIDHRSGRPRASTRSPVFSSSRSSRERSDLDGIKESWGDKVVAELCEYAPNLKDHILDRAIITPQDLERATDMITEG